LRRIVIDANVAGERVVTDDAKTFRRAYGG
jgi:hypothetical protein